MSQKSFYGVNQIGNGDAAAVYLDQLRPTVHFVMDGWKDAYDAQQKYPEMIVIHRASDPEEAGMHRTAGRVRQHLIEKVNETPAHLRDLRIYYNLGTEPSIDREKFPNDLKDIVREYGLAAQWAVDNNVRVALPHGAFYGLYGEDDFRELAKLTDLIAAHPDLLLFTCDEYFIGHAFSGVDQDTPGIPNEPQTIYPDKWKASPIDLYWHMGRITVFFRWLLQHGKKLPLTVITETGADALQDVPKFKDSIKRTPGWSDIRGWKTLTAQWVEWYGQYGWSPQQAFVEMLYAFWREVYSEWPNILGACIFAWGSNGDPDWNQFRIDEPLAEELRDQLASKIYVETNPVPELNSVDLSTYLLGDGRRYRLEGMGDETLQTQRANGYGYQVKNEHWEEIWYDAHNIYRGMDTSPGDGKVYQLYDGSRYGSVWCPRVMQVGQVVKRSPTVVFRQAANGVEVTRYPHTTYLKLEKHHPTFLFKSGVTLPNVVELRAMADKGGQPDSASFETYYYADKHGLVGWKGSGVGESYISPQAATADPVRERLAWHSSPTPPPVIAAPPVLAPVNKPDPAGSGIKAQITSNYNVRYGPNTNYGIKFGLVNGEPVTYYPDYPIQGGSYSWVWVEAGSKGGWIANQGQWKIDLGEPITVNPLVFVDQYGTDAASPNACGPASGAMIVNSFYRAQGHAGQITALQFSSAMRRNPGEASILDVLPRADGTIPSSRGNVGDTLRTVYQITTVFRHPNSKDGPPSLASMRDLIRAGGYVVPLFERGEVPGTQSYYPFTRAHIAVVYGEGDGFFVMADPLATDDFGRALKVRDADLWRAMARSSWASQQVVTYNSGPQALYIARQTEPEMPDIDPELQAALLAELDIWADQISEMRQQLDRMEATRVTMLSRLNS